ncbi:PAS domain-containing protein [Streptomyces sp. SHP 1-2]|uniref:PAS domain-containing protein n=1 Tax=Streptomyces sp. SHP 1-2 TaxID=2769489 RepID=UPI00223849DA|nr:PAS domain-containing protein [Streptomyces sp. SHP 1-2]MCW5252068.1 PAS domain-containing protein [Streptomyces sp. SHP 1-2]
MPSPLSAGRPAAPSPHGALDALILRTRRLRGDVDAARHAAPDGAAHPPGARRHALYAVALRHLDAAGRSLADLRGLPAAGEPSGPPGRAGSAEWDLLTGRADWSAGLFRILGRDPDSAPLGLDSLPSVVLPEDRPALTEMVTDCLVDARPVDGEFRVRRPDGTVQPVHMLGGPVPGPDGGTASMWAVLRETGAPLHGPRARHTPGRSAAPGGRDDAGAAAPPWRGPLRFPRRGRPGLDLAGGGPASADGGPGAVGWYDACALGGDGTLLTVGVLAATAPGTASAPVPATAPEERTDIGGTSAFQGTAALLGALRGLALAGVGPRELPDRLALFLWDTALPAPAGTVCCGYRPGARALTWAHPGGPAPLLFRDGAARVLDGPGHTAVLAPGDLLVLRTTTAGPDRGRLPALAARLSGARTAGEALRRLTGVPGGPVASRPEAGGWTLVARVTE